MTRITWNGPNGKEANLDLSIGGHANPEACAALSALWYAYIAGIERVAKLHPDDVKLYRCKRRARKKTRLGNESGLLGSILVYGIRMCPAPARDPAVGPLPPLDSEELTWPCPPPFLSASALVFVGLPGLRSEGLS